MVLIATVAGLTAVRCIRLLLERIAQCAAEVARFCAEVALPWFERFAGPRILLASESPLSESARLNLERSFKGLANPETVQLSKALLGVA